MASWVSTFSTSTILISVNLFFLLFLFQVLLMSLKAGGVGLNLTAASNVFLMVNVTAELLLILEHYFPLLILYFVCFDM